MAGLGVVPFGAAKPKVRARAASGKLTTDPISCERVLVGLYRCLSVESIFCVGKHQPPDGGNGGQGGDMLVQASAR